MVITVKSRQPEAEQFRMLSHFLSFEMFVKKSTVFTVLIHEKLSVLFTFCE